MPKIESIIVFSLTLDNSAFPLMRDNKPDLTIEPVCIFETFEHTDAIKYSYLLNAYYSGDN